MFLVISGFLFFLWELSNCHMSPSQHIGNEQERQLLVYYQHVPNSRIPVPAADPVLKRKYLRLFQKSSNDSFSNNVVPRHPQLIEASKIAEINKLCPRNEFFYSFSPNHVQAMEILQDVFTALPTAYDIYEVARDTLERGEVNKKVWFHALLATILERTDLTGYQLGWALDAIPDVYITASILELARTRQLKINGDACILYNGTKGSSTKENKLWYFREDIMVNHHHWYWHQYNPLSSKRHPDRRGELFYYFHHNAVARYNAERLSNGLEPEVAIELTDADNGANLAEGYNADLIDKESGKYWSPRDANTHLKEINAENYPEFELEITPKHLSNLYRALAWHAQQGFLFYDGGQNSENNSVVAFNIRNFEGVNHFGNTVEAVQNLSLHPEIYTPQGLHNLGHLLIALQAHPDRRLPCGVMADSLVSMRDPSFYKFHTLLDNLFDLHKRTLPPYQLEGGEWPLRWKGVSIFSLEIVAVGNQPNLVKTFWDMHTFPLGQGIGASIHNGDVQANICHVHLNHEPFTFQITVDVDEQIENESGRGTMRIFMAPRYNQNGTKFNIWQTRKLMFLLDVFNVELRFGRNVITRDSQDSVVTKPWSKSLPEMMENLDNNGGDADYCGCGWPDHLHIPKGTEQGMQFDLFAVVTNSDFDMVQDDFEDRIIPQPCHSAYALCGVPFKKYPDRRPMGYPFDRLPYFVDQKQVENLEEYASHVCNMKTTVITIQHVDTLQE